MPRLTLTRTFTYRGPEANVNTYITNTPDGTLQLGEFVTVTIETVSREVTEDPAVSDVERFKIERDQARVENEFLKKKLEENKKLTEPPV